MDKSKRCSVSVNRYQGAPGIAEKGTWCGYASWTSFIHSISPLPNFRAWTLRKLRNSPGPRLAALDQRLFVLVFLFDFLSGTQR